MQCLPVAATWLRTYAIPQGPQDSTLDWLLLALLVCAAVAHAGAIGVGNHVHVTHTQKPQRTDNHRSQSLVTMAGAGITSGSTTRQVLSATLHYGTLPVKTHNSGPTCDQLLQRQLSK